MESYGYKYLVLIILLICSLFAKSQELFIDEISVSKAIVNVKNIVDEHITEGPVISIKAIIKNNSDSSLIIYPCKSDIYVSFQSDTIVYNQEYFGISLLNFMDKEKISIEPHSQIQLNLSTPLFIGTAILKRNRSFSYDYTKDLIMTLPTLRLHYKDLSINLVSNAIKRVIVTSSFNYTP